MHEIDKVIKSLLIVEDKISLPGVGGFIKVHKNAETKTGNQLITPPTKSVAFNKYLHDDNDLLLKTLIEREKLSPGAAEKMLNDYVGNIQKKLNKGESVEIEGVGKIKKLADGNFEFISYIQDDELADNFGLTLLEIDTSEENTENMVTAPSVKNESVKTNAAKSNKSTIYLILAIFLVLLAPVVYFLLNNETVVKKENPEKSLVEQVESEVAKIENEQQRYADSIDRAVEQKLHRLTDKGSALHPQDANDEYYNQFSRFYLVAGSFKNIDFARELENELKNMGYTNTEIISSKGYFRVTITSFTSRENALEKLNELRRNYSSRVWILSV